MGDPVLKKAICDEWVETFARKCADAAERGALEPKVMEALTRLDETYLSYGKAILFEYDEQAMGQVPVPYKKE